MEKLIRYLGALDWLLAGGTLIVGLGLQNWWLAAAGLAGLGMAYLQPAKRVNAYVAKKFVRKRDRGEGGTSQVEQDEAFYAQVLGEVQVQEEQTAAAPRVRRTFASSPLPYARTYLSTNKHNRLKAAHLQLYSQNADGRYF